MNSIAIFFVPAGATRGDFERALREHLEQFEIVERSDRCEVRTAAAHEPEPMPLWTWFLPNQRPERA